MSLVGIYLKSLPQYEYERVYDVIFANILKGCLRWVEIVQPVMFFLMTGWNEKAIN